jgi:hypothetical protein
MSWVSSMGRRFLQAYSEGLVMTCPMHRGAADHGLDAGKLPAAIDRPQDNVRAALRPEVAAGFAAKGSQLRH